MICFELGLAEYRSQNWSIAQSHFKKAVQISDDLPAKTFAERCRGILEGEFDIPPIGVWDGTWNVSS